MTRAECEDKIKDLFNQILDVYKEYNPAGKYLSASLTENSYCFINNCFWEEGDGYERGDDYDTPINFHWKHEK